MKRMNKGMATVWVVLLTALISIVVGGAVWYYLDTQQPTVSTPQPPAIQPTSPQPADKTANWRLYTNVEQGFTFKYPPSLVISKIRYDKNGDFTEVSLGTNDVSFTFLVNDPGRGFENFSEQVSKSEVTIDGIKTTKTVLEENPEVTKDPNIERAIFASFEKTDPGGADGDNKDNYFLFFRYQKQNDQSELFDQIISTFKLT